MINEQKNDLCVVDIDTQTMRVECANGFEKHYKISTSKNGVGNESGSYKTPLGRHTICEKVGEYQPLYAIFKARQHNGMLCTTLNTPIDQDLILTRILRLKGEEPGVNSGYTPDGKCIDSYERYIYIHGTNREDLLSTAASDGCIRMGNADIVELFQQVRMGGLVNIVGP